MNLPISPAQEIDIIDGVKSDLVKHFVTQKAESFDYFQAAQVAGMLNISPATLAKLPIPRYPLGGRLIFYKLSEVETYIAGRKTR